MPSAEVSRGGWKLLVETAAGAGKTRTTAAFIKSLFDAGITSCVLFLVDRIVLSRQAEDVFNDHLRVYPYPLVDPGSEQCERGRLHWRHVCTESDCPHARRCGGAGPKLLDPWAEELCLPGSSQRPMVRCNLQCGSFRLSAAIKGGRPPSLQAMQVSKTDPQDNEDEVKWPLLTSLPVDSAEAAHEVIGLYLNRWKIEDYFRILR